MKLFEKIGIGVMVFLSFVLFLIAFLTGGCTDEKGLSKESECLFKSTICHVAKFDKETEVCTERDIHEGEPCNTRDPCISWCRCQGSKPQRVMLPQIDDGNQCTQDQCKGDYAYSDSPRAIITHENMPDGSRCGPTGTSNGQCRRGLCVMPEGNIYIDQPMPFNFPAD